LISVDGIKKAARDHQYREIMTESLQVLRQLHARTLRQVEIGDEQIDLRSASEDMSSTLRVSGAEDAITFMHKKRSREGAYIRIIIHQQNGTGRGRGRGV